jgi:hypothetical protein
VRPDVFFQRAADGLSERHRYQALQPVIVRASGRSSIP